MTWSRLARLRVTLVFAAFGIAFWLGVADVDHPRRWCRDCTVGQALRVCGHRHIEKGREVTRSGPYSLMSTPYVGSAILGLGFFPSRPGVFGTALLWMAYFLVTIWPPSDGGGHAGPRFGANTRRSARVAPRSRAPVQRPGASA